MLKKLNNLQIRDRLIHAFVTIACILTAVSAVILITMIVMSRLYASVLTNYGFSQGDIGRAMAQFADTRSAMRGIIGYDEQSAIDKLLEDRVEYKDSFIKEFKEEIVSLGATTDREKCKIAQDMALGELVPIYEEIYNDLTQIMEIKVDKGQEVSSTLAIIIIALTVIIILVITASINLSWKVDCKQHCGSNRPDQGASGYLCKRRPLIALPDC